MSIKTEFTDCRSHILLTTRKQKTYYVFKLNKCTILGEILAHFDFDGSNTSEQQSEQQKAGSFPPAAALPAPDV